MSVESHRIKADLLGDREIVENQNTKSSRIILLLTFSIALTVYLISMPDDLTWSHFGGDGGELITASITLGIPHPPGYPTYVLLGKAISLLPIGTIAFRYHLLSAFAMAVAAAFVSQVSLEHKLRYEREIGQSEATISLAAITAGLIFAFLPLIWSQAIIAEVYALNLAFLSILIWILLTGRYPFLAGILFGLSMTSHMTSLLFLPLCLFILAKRKWSSFIIGSFVGLLPLFALFIFADGSSPVIWGQPNHIKEWWWLVSGRLYLLNSFDLSSIDWATRIPSWFSLLLVPVALLSISLRYLIASKFWLSYRRKVILMLLTALLYAGYTFGYAAPDALVLLLPGLLLMTMVIGFGIRWSGRYSVLLAVFMIVYGGFILTSESGPSLRPRFEQALSEVPGEAIIITPGDPTVAATWYFAYAEEQRPDVIVVDDNMFQFGWYRAHLADKYPDLAQLTEDNLPAFVQSNIAKYTICRLSMYSEIYLNCEEPKL